LADPADPADLAAPADPASPDPSISGATRLPDKINAAAYNAALR